MMDEILQQEEVKPNNARERIKMFPDFHLVLASKETVRKLNMLLKPATALMSRGLDYLAGELGFNIDDIEYIKTKEYPLLYLLDQYLRRSMYSTTLNSNLKYFHEIFISMKRYDAAEVIEKELEVLHQKDPKELADRELECKERLCRRIPTVNLQTETSSLDVAEKPLVNLLPGFSSNNKANTSANPKKVYIISCAENDRHVKNVKRFTKKLRTFGIDATSDMNESLTSEQDRGFYIASNILQADYVIVVCSPMFIKAYDYSPNDKKTVKGEIDLHPEELKKVLFYVRLITSDIYESHGCNGKYIPVVFNSKNIMNVPGILTASSVYVMETDIIKLKYRILDIEEYKLPPESMYKPAVKPQTISGIQLLKLVKKSAN